MGSTGWSDPEQVLTRALTLLKAPLSETLPRLSTVVEDLVPHRALAMLTGDCSRFPLITHGEEPLVATVTSRDMALLAGRVDVGRPWFGKASFSGAEQVVLALTSKVPNSAGALLVVVPTDPEAEPDDAARRLLQQLWDLTNVHVLDLIREAVPVYATGGRAAGTERVRAVADLADAHSVALTTLLGALRSRGLDDATARRTATDLAMSALLELRATASQDRAQSEETAEEAFSRLVDKLTLLSRYHDVVLEFARHESDRQLPVDIVQAARATVRGTVLAMLEQGGVSRIRVTWRGDEAELRVTVRDDGPGALTADDLGVHRIADRITALNGTLELDVVPTWGAIVTAAFPLVRPGHAAPAVSPPLNERELAVLGHLTRGRRNRQIAEDLYISEHTVKFHVAKILDKLGVSTRGEAAAAARSMGLMSDSGSSGQA